MKSVACLLLLLTTACTAPDPVRPHAPIAPARTEIETIEAQAQVAARSSAPRKEHRSLGVLVGTWDTSVVTVAESGAESDARPGHARIEWIFGGRYLRWEAELELGADQHATTGFFGYDVNQSEYQMLMISDLATGMGVARGRGEADARGIRLTLEIFDGASGAIRRAVSTLRVLSPDHFVFEQIGPDATGVERVVRRTHYQRSG